MIRHHDVGAVYIVHLLATGDVDLNHRPDDRFQKQALRYEPGACLRLRGITVAELHLPSVLTCRT